MSRGAAVVEGNTVYISVNETQEVYSCFIISGDQQWSTLARHQYRDFSLVLINGLLTSVGGYRGYGSGDYANSLLSLTGEGWKRQWSEVLPACTYAKNTADSRDYIIIPTGAAPC